MIVTSSKPERVNSLASLWVSLPPLISGSLRPAIMAIGKSFRMFRVQEAFVALWAILTNSAKPLLVKTKPTKGQSGSSPFLGGYQYSGKALATAG